jgi:hypothetical protein
VPLFLGDPGSKPRPLHYQGAPFGVPPPSFLFEGGQLNLPITRRDLRAAMTLERKKELPHPHKLVPSRRSPR